MNFDSDMTNRLSEMNQAQLSKKIEEISSILGIDPSLVKKTVGSPEEIQKKLKGLSEKDIRRMADKIDPETLNKINNTLGE